MRCLSLPLPLPLPSRPALARPETPQAPRSRRAATALASLLAVIGLAACNGDGSPSASPTDFGGEAPSKRAQAALAEVVTSNTWVTVPAPADPLLQGLTIPADAPTRGMWGGVQPWPLSVAHATLLPNGKLMSFGSAPDLTTVDARWIDVWDPVVGFNGPAAHATSFSQSRVNSFCSTSAFLSGGDLMITGGYAANVNSLFSTTTGQVSSFAGAPSDERWYATMLTLPDGRQVILGGMVPDAEKAYLNPDLAVAQGLMSMTPEVYESGTWRSLLGAYSREAFGPDNLRGAYPRAWVAPNGRVFGISTDRMWTLDPTGNGALTIHGAFKTAPNTTSRPNVGANGTGVMFDIGKILMVGGNGVEQGDGLPASKQATVVNINSGSPVLSEQLAMTYPRRFASALVLPGGQVLLAGGSMNAQNNGPDAVYAAELWDSKTGNWTVGANAAIYRGYHSTAALLPNGTVLTLGGGVNTGPVVNFNAEVYYPPQLFRTVNGVAQLAPRPVMKGISANQFAHGAPMQIDMASTATVSQLVLLGTSNATHGFDHHQRRIPLTFTQNAQRLTANVPSSALTPPGYYQVVAIDAAGVPSRGFIVAIGLNQLAPPDPVTPYTPPVLTSNSINAQILVAGGVASYALPDAPGVSYSWDFGDGTAPTAYAATSAVLHAFTKPGLYTVTLSARGSDGAISRRSIVQSVLPTTPRTAKQPSSSGPMALEYRSNASARLWVANPDNDTVGLVDGSTRKLLGEVAVGSSPRSVAIAPDGRVWVTNKGSASISIVNPLTLAVVQTINLPRASQPHGLAFSPQGGSAFVVLEGTGQLLKLDASTGAQQGALAVGDNARHVSVTADGVYVAVSRFITPPLPGEGTATVTPGSAGGELLAVTAANMALAKTVVLAHSNKVDAENQGSGVPNYLGALAISPDGLTGWVPSKQDNVRRGMLRNQQQLTFQNTVRAISSRIDMTTGVEDLSKRIDHDNAGLGTSAVYHPSGAYLFVTLETSRQLAVVDAVGGREVFRVDVGRAPQGVLVAADGNTLVVQNFMDRSVSVIDLRPLVQNGELRAPVVNTIVTAAVEKLDPTVLVGKQLFYDAKDTRLARDGYISCAACHNDGGHDGRVWDMTGFGEGLRNTIALKGRGAISQGALHWSANFDEVQDFEAQIRALAGGTGLMNDATLAAGTRNQALGDPKAGLSAGLDAMAAYLASLNKFDASPLRPADGGLSTAALAGRTVFQTAKCAECHNGSAFTMSSNASGLRNVGTIKPSSGQRLNAALTGIDVPTLRDVWATAPYLHDGSARTLAAAVQAHQGNTVAGTDLSNLVAYLQQIGGEEPGPNTALLSRGKLATQSSTDFGGLASRAVDGSTAGAYSDNSVSHTLSEAQPWWQVDLGQTAAVSEVTLHNRTDCCSDRLGNFYVLASATDMTGKTLAQLLADANVVKRLVPSLDGASAITVNLANAQARFVRVQLVGSNVLSLAEVQVWGASGLPAASLLSQGKVASQSSLDWGGAPDRAVDGNTSGVFNEGSVTHTLVEAQPWWQVDLGRVAVVRGVTLWNRTDACCTERLANLVVLVSSTDMTGKTLAQLMADTTVAKRSISTLAGQPSFALDFGTTNGRYVRVVLQGSSTALSLAEVQVFGY